MNKLLAISLACATLLGASLNAQAADYPLKDKVITIVVPFAAGGPTDRVARDLAEAMRKPLGGNSIIIDSAAGAGGSISRLVLDQNERERQHDRPAVGAEEVDQAHRGVHPVRDCAPEE